MMTTTMEMILIHEPLANLPLSLRVDPTDRGAVFRMREASPKPVTAFQGSTKRLSVTEADLRTINDRHSSTMLATDDVVIFERYSANDSVMRSPLKFTRQALEKFAQDFTQGRGVHLNHDDGQGFARTFGADVVSAKVRGIDANWLRIKFYAVVKDATDKRRQTIQDVQTGVLGYDSITVMGGLWEFKEIEADGRETLYFYEIDDSQTAHPRLEAVELSVLSTLGNVYGAGSEKGKNQLTALSARQDDIYADVRVGAIDREPDPDSATPSIEDPYAGLTPGSEPRKGTDRLSVERNVDPDDVYSDVLASASGDPENDVYEGLRA